MEMVEVTDINKIMDMLDWNMPLEVQADGIALAKSMGTITPFILPLSPQYNKNVWENCAIVIAEKSDEELKPHLTQLLEWIRDVNWPGAFRILDRLHTYSDKDTIRCATYACLEKAKRRNDEIWAYNLNSILFGE